MTDERINDFMTQVSRGRLAAVLAAIEAADTDYPRRYGLVLDALALAHRVGYQAGIGWDHEAGPEFDGFRVVVYLELPTGQVSWHMPEHSKPFDGHDTPKKLERCNEFAARYLAPQEADRG